MESESSAGEDCVENIRALDQLLCATRVVFKDKSAMMKFLFGEFRRWGGRQLLNQIYFERTGRVKWMPEASDAVLVPVKHTFFHTAISSSRPIVQLAEPDGETDATPDPDAVPQPELPSPAATRVFNFGLETTVECIMGYQQRAHFQSIMTSMMLDWSVVLAHNGDQNLMICL